MASEALGRIGTVLTKLVDAVVLSTVWLVCCMPIVTAGVSSTALYYAVHKSLVRNRGYILKSFWHGLKTNFKQSTISWLIQLAVMIVLCFDIRIMRGIAEMSTVYATLLYFFYVLVVLMIVWMFYTFAYQARFENTIKNSLKNAAAIAFLNLPWSFLMVVFLAVTVLTIIVVPVFIFLMPAVLFWVYDLILERVFRKYMTPEDLEREKENDMIDKE